MQVGPVRTPSEMWVKICLCYVLDLKTCVFELQPHKIWRLSRGQYLLTVFLRNPVTFKRVKERTTHSVINSVSFIYALKTNKQTRENLQSSLWVWWDKSLSGGANIQHCLRTTAAKSPVSVSIWEEHFIWIQQSLSGREEGRLLALAWIKFLLLQGGNLVLIIWKQSLL